jgi:nucleotide-binding universal stress UspA family protein
MPAPILVPLDTSMFANHALPVVRAIARQSGSEVHLARVTPGIARRTVDSPAPAPDVSLTRRARETWERHLEDTGRYFFAELGARRVRTALLEGTELVPTLTSYARSEEIGLIAMATSGLRSDGYTRGMSVAARLVRESELPLLAVHPEAETARYTPGRRLHRVLIAISGSELDSEILGAVELIDCAEPLHCTLVHVLPPSGEPEGAGGSWMVVQPAHGRAESALAYLKGHAAVLEASGHTVEILVAESDHPSTAITAIARARHVQAELVIAGSMRRAGSKREGFGTVTTSLFGELALPLLVIAPGTRTNATVGAATEASGGRA